MMEFVCVKRENEEFVCMKRENDGVRVCEERE